MAFDRWCLLALKEPEGDTSQWHICSIGLNNASWKDENLLKSFPSIL